MKNFAKKAALTVGGVVLLAGLVLLAGCSDEQKDDAARLEQEVLNQGADASASDTTPVDSAVAEAEVMDVEAVPEEEEVSYEPVGSGYAVQVASCEDSDYAQWLVKRYTNQGYTTYLTTFDHMGQTFSRVRLGPYETKEGAEQVKADMVDKFSIDPWIVME